MNGIDAIAQERATHEARGYTATFDDAHNADGELPYAAICYLSPQVAESFWPWEGNPPQPTGNVEQRIKRLAKAGALVAAEIDRLTRLTKPTRSCNYEDCDQDPAPGSIFCKGHLEQELQEQERQEAIRQRQALIDASGEPGPTNLRDIWYWMYPPTE
jgi:hypothetical protein